jgi:bifunctional non-homologous end joining protein LigD
LALAEKIFATLLKEKCGKGYQLTDTSSPIVGIDLPIKKEANEDMLPQLLNPIENVEDFLKNDCFIAQEKMDGERRKVSFTPLSGGTISQYNRKGGLIPTITNLKEDLNGQFGVYDGEMVGEVFHIFDLISLDGIDLRGLPFITRAEKLSKLSFGKGVKVVKVTTGTNGKKKLFAQLTRDNKEGIVFKKADSVYSAGRPASGGDQLKFKFYKTATFIVSSLTKGKRSVGLELIDKGERVFMGKVTVLPNFEVPSVGELVEVRYLYCFKGGAVFQPIYLGSRNDIEIGEALLTQIIYKSED